jgi:hypothetical protein
MSGIAPPLLALPGPQYWHDFEGGDFEVCGNPIRVQQEGGQVGRESRGLLALRTWHTSHQQAASADSTAKSLVLLQGRGTGWSVWDGAVAAARHLEQLCCCGSLPAFDPPRALELGSGTGLAGLAAAVATGLPTTLTDLQEVLPALQRNVDSNKEVCHRWGGGGSTGAGWQAPASYALSRLVFEDLLQVRLGINHI